MSTIALATKNNEKMVLSSALKKLHNLVYPLRAQFANRTVVQSLLREVDTLPGLEINDTIKETVRYSRKKDISIEKEKKERKRERSQGEERETREPTFLLTSVKQQTAPEVLSNLGETEDTECRQRTVLTRSQ
jgi:hypothetical protein